MEKLDVVYLEPDLGSLFGAVALAAGGLKVLVLVGERVRASPPPGDKLQGVKLSREPFLLRGLRSGGFLEPLYNRLGLLNQAREKVERIDPPLQVITTDTRVEVRSEREDLTREFSREFGKSSRNALSLFARFEEMAEEAYKLMKNESFPLTPKSLTDRLFRRSSSERDIERLRSTTLASVLNEHRLEEPFRSFLLTILAGLGTPGHDDLPAYAAAVLIDSVRRGIYRADEGELMEILLSAFKAKGGYTFPSGELESAEIGGREIVTLRMAKSNYLKSRLYVGSATRWAQYLPGELKQSILPPGAPLMHRLEVLVDAQAIPVGMKDRVMALSRPAEVMLPESVLSISVSVPIEEDGNVLKVITAQSPRSGGGDARKELKGYLTRIIPFLEEYQRGERYTASALTRGTDPGKRFLEAPPGGPVDNLLPLESELLAGMGLGDGIVSGRILARVILRKLGLRVEI